MENLVLVKLGGSLITDKAKPFMAKTSVIKRLAGEIKDALKTYKGKIILAHGSGSYGHTFAAKYKTQEGIIDKESLIGFPLVADAAIQINRIVMEELLRESLPVISFSPLSFIYASNKSPLNSFTDSISQALKIGLIPVVYGDVIMDRKRGFCIFSGEKTLSLLTSVFRKNYKTVRIILCGDTDGVLDNNGKTIPLINKSVLDKLKPEIKGSKETDVTGGMHHKVEESIKVAEVLGIQTLIINGNRSGNLKKAILNKKLSGTLIKA